MGNKVEAAKEKKPVLVMDHLRFGVDFRKELKKVLGKVPPEHFVRMALTAMQKQPKLALCSQESIFQCLLDCASVDLEPDGRRAHLIPYGDKCTLVIDYKGYVDLMTRPGKGNEVAFIDAAIVYDKDDFDWNMNRVMRHRFDIKADDRGEPIGAYVAINYKNGMVKYEFMTRKEILSIKERSKAVISAKKYKNFDTPWYTDEMEMWKKCPLRRAAKWVPINDQTARAMEIDYDRFEQLNNDVGDEGKANPPEVPLIDKGEVKGPWEDPNEIDRMAKKPGAGKKPMPTPQPGQDEPPDEGFEDEGQGEEQQQEEQRREPGQDEDPGVKPEEDPKVELQKLLHATCRGDAAKIATHLKRLTKYESKKTGKKSEGKDDIDRVTPMEAKIALAKLRTELGFDS